MNIPEILPCPNPECKAECGDFYFIHEHPDDSEDGKHPVNDPVIQVQCSKCQYSGPMIKIIGHDTLTATQEAIRLHNAICRQPTPEAARELNLKWGRHDGRGECHIEWHAPCGCAYHPEPKPHVHPCIKHGPITEEVTPLYCLREMWLDFPGLNVSSLSTLCIKEMSPEQAGFYAMACEVAKSECAGPAHPPKPTTEAPPAYMFSVRRVSPAGQPSLDTFAAIDYHCQDGEELKSKEPLFYGVAPKPPAEQISGVPLLHPQPKPGESVTVSYEPPAEWMEALAKDLLQVVLFADPDRMPFSFEGALEIIQRHAPKVPEGWQPIETAPKDGTVIDLWDAGSPGSPFGGHRLCDAKWDYQHWMEGKPQGEKDWLPGHRDGPAYHRITHWRHKPAVPKGEA